MKKIIHSTLISAVLTLATVASAAPVTSAADAALSNSALIDFNTTPIGSKLSYDMGAVTFRSLSSTKLSIHDENNQHGTSGRALLIFSIPAFEAVFDTTASAFGVIGGDYNAPWTFTAYGVNDNIIETINVNHPCCKGYFDGIAAAGIKHITFFNVNADVVLFDDFRFTTTQVQSQSQSEAVPEPGSLALLGLGLIGFITARRKKN